ncbi:MAG: hypothetical protein A2046_14015 [Bacteroidetes bacterium GWA2_30_7]|nr:MAG: hypothetical protein A2046_14015 [Bacteroidetes bacterium GWA2_30_7]
MFNNVLIILLIVALHSMSIAQSTDYKVIKVSGTILLQKSKAALQMGTIFGENDELSFETNNARAAVTNSEKGRFILMPSNTNIAFAKANLSPAMSNISSRGGSILNIIDLENHFSGKYAIIDNVELKINPTLFPMDKNNFFYMRYVYKGDTINKQLSYSNDTLIIKKSELLTVDGKPIPNPDVSTMEILYMQKGTEVKRTYINSFDPVFLNEVDLLAEIMIILSDLKDKDRETKINEIISYITEMYGKPNKENLEEWLDKNIKL